METIFDHSPTIEELEELFGYDRKADKICHCLTTKPFPASEYSIWTRDRVAYFDIGLLLDYRGELRSAEYFAKAPEIWEEYKIVRNSINF